MVSKLGILSLAVTSVWVSLPQVSLELWNCSNMPLAVERDVKPKNLTFALPRFELTTLGGGGGGSQIC